MRIEEAVLSASNIIGRGYSRIRKNNDEMIIGQKAAAPVQLFYFRKRIAAEHTKVNSIRVFLKGIGFRAVMLRKDVQSYLYLDIGYSHFYFLEVPKSVGVIVRKYDLYLYGKNFVVLKEFLSTLIKLRRPDVYKHKGLVIEGQNLRKKKGKQR